MLYIALIGLIALICIWAFVETMKLGKGQTSNKEQYYASNKSYSSLSYIYGITFLFAFLIIVVLIMVN